MAAIKAPENVPKAWAKKGKIKCLGSNNGNDNFNPSIVVTSAPFGGGIMEPLTVIIAIFTILPSTIPIIIAKLFLIIFILLNFNCLFTK